MAPPHEECLRYSVGYPLTVKLTTLFMLVSSADDKWKCCNTFKIQIQWHSQHLPGLAKFGQKWGNLEEKKKKMIIWGKWGKWNSCPPWTVADYHCLNYDYHIWIQHENAFRWVPKNLTIGSWYSPMKFLKKPYGF